jgi:tricorn protease
MPTRARSNALANPLLALAACSFAAHGLCGAPEAHAATVDLPRHPALSPDGTVVVFSWRGDLWRAPAGGGEAVRLTSNPANETRSGFTADGARIVFESEREGGRNLWSMRPDGSDLRRVTELDASFALSSVGVFGGRPVAFIESTLEGDLFRSSRPFMVPLDLAEGATAAPARVHDAFGGAPNASSAGGAVLFERGGSGWLRRGYTGPDNRDVWFFDAEAKTFTQLTRHPGNDGMPRFIGAEEFVYVSDRGTGTLNLHRAKLGAAVDSGARLTDFKDTDIHGLAVSADGRVAVFAVFGDLWSLDLSREGAEPARLAFTASDDGLVEREFKQVGRDVSEAVLSPDGKTMAVVASGDVFVRAVEDKSPSRRVTSGEAREREIAWSADGLTLYFVTDEDGSESIHAATVAETRAEARERGKPKPPAAAEAKAEEPKAEEPKAEEGKVEEAKVEEPKPEEPKPEEPKTEEPKIDEPKSEEPAEKKDDKKSDAKKKDEKKDPALDPSRWADAVRFTVTPVTSGLDDDRGPVASPDGRWLLFRRNLGDVMRLDLATGEISTVRTGWDSTVEYVFSPDGALLAIAESDQDFNTDIWVMPADGSRPAVNVTRHPDNDGMPRFSADGRMLAFLSERTNEELDAWVVYLDRDIEGKSERDLAQYFKDAAEAAKKRKPLEPVARAKDAAAPAEKKDEASEAKDESKDDVKDDLKDESKNESKEGARPASTLFDELELDDAFLRLRRVTTLPGSEGGLELLPSGERLVFTGSEGRERALLSVKYDGTDQKRIGADVRVTGLSFAGDRIVAVSGGQAQSIAAAGGDGKTIDISATSEIDLAKLNEHKLREVSRLMQRGFYMDPAEKGLDWAALTERHAALARVARTADEFDFVANMFIGHLDASHLGVRSASEDAAPRRAHGRIGVSTEAAEGGRRVTAVLPDSPAALASPAIAVGDVVVSVDFEPVDPSRPLEAAFAGKTGQEVFVGFRRAGADPAAPQELGAIVVPISSAAERSLRYAAETLANRKKVEERSGGRLGYLHIQGMDQGSLDRFERDLYAAAAGKEGLVVDVRNNGGGWTADRLLASIDVREHAYVVPRGGDRSRIRSYPQDRLFIQRYTMPMAMLCNEKSFSNAEIISHAFKTLGRGPLVGQQTAGGVISTGSASLVDGTTVRMPFRGWYLAGGVDMEENGAMPDFVVPQTPEAESARADLQLEKAVDELMRALPAKKAESK